MDETREFCRANGYVLTLFGRKCHYPDIKASNPSIRSFNERAAINARLQGSRRRHHPPRHDAHGAANSPRPSSSAQMLLQVHDELIFEVPDGEVAKTMPVVKRVMEDAPHPAMSLHVPLQVDARAAAQLGRGALSYGCHAARKRGIQYSRRYGYDALAFTGSSAFADGDG